MKQSGNSNLFALVCIAALLGAYGVGLGVRKIRGVGAEAEASPAVTLDEQTDEPEEEAVAANENAEPESADEPEEEVAQEQEEPDSQPERREGRRGMMGEGMRERFQNMSEEERREAMAQMRERFGGRSRGDGGGRGGFSQMSEEDRANFRVEMEALGARADEMSEEDLQQARREVMEKYGISRGGGGGRPGGGEGGRRRSGGRQ